MGKSMFGAQVAFAAFQKVLSLITDGLKDSITKFIQQEKVEAQLNQTLKSTQYAAGLTAQELKNMAKGFQQVTNFGDEAVIGAENLLLTFTKIGKDIFPDATEIVLDMSQALGQDLKSSAIQVGKALQDPILGATALRRVGVNLSESTAETIKQLVALGKTSEAQAIIMQELQTEFGGSARAARETFGGAVKSLENNFGDLQETQGKYIATAITPFINAMDEMVVKTDEFLRSEEGFKQVTGILSTLAGVVGVIQQVFDRLSKTLGETFDKIVKNVEKNFSGLVEEGSASNVVFTLLSGAVEGLAFGFSVLGNFLNLVISGIIDLVKAAVSSIETLGKFGEALFDPLNQSKWDAAGKAGENAIAKFSQFGSNAVTNFHTLISEAVDGFNNLWPNIETGAEDLQSAFDDAFSAMETNMQKFKESSNELVSNFIDMPPEIEEVNNELLQLAAEWVEVQKTLGETETQTKVRHLEEQAEKYRQVAEDKEAVERWLQNEIAKLNDDTQNEIIETWGNTWNKLTEELQNFSQKFGMFSQEWNMKFRELMGHFRQGIQGFADTFNLVYGSISAVSEQRIENELQRNENEYQKKKEWIENNVTDEAEKNKQLEQLEKEHHKKEADLKKQQFKAQKRADIIQSLINTAVGVTKALGSAFFPLNIIFASIVGAAGAAQTAMIASQPMPEFAKGGVGRGLMLVGEEGPEYIDVGRTSRIYNAEESSVMAGRGGVNQTINFTGDINNDIDIERQLQLAGARLESNMRGAA